MCGINGFAGNVPEVAREPFEYFATRLMVGTQVRGEHATGVACYAGPNKKHVGKGPVNAERFVRTPVWKKALASKSVIGHCRWATHGNPMKNENNHPFESGKWSLVHNGIIYGYKYIAEKERVNLVSECDSEIILRVFARGAKGGAGPKAGLQRWVDSTRGLSARYAIALIDHTNGKIRLLRDNGSPCAIVRLPSLGVVAFASTEEILKRAMEETRNEFKDFPLLDGAAGWECKPDRVYVLSPNSLEIEHEELSFPTQKQIGFRSRYERGSYDSSKPTSTGTYELRQGEEVVICCEMCGEAQSQCKCEELTRPE